jgi:hypothetical protein
VKKISFSVSGRRYEVELENNFAMFVMEKFEENNISPDKDNDIPKLLNLYLKALKQNFDTQKEIEDILVQIPV